MSSTRKASNPGVCPGPQACHSGREGIYPDVLEAYIFDRRRAGHQARAASQPAIRVASDEKGQSLKRPLAIRVAQSPVASTLCFGRLSLSPVTLASCPSA